MTDHVLMVRETIETHLDDLCPVEDGTIAEALDLMGDDISASTVEEAFTEALGSSPQWEEKLYDDIASSLLEANVTFAS